MRIKINEEQLNQIVSENIHKYVINEGGMENFATGVINKLSNGWIGQIGRWKQRKSAAMNGQVLINNAKSFKEHAQYQITLANNIAQLIGGQTDTKSVEEACKYLMMIVNGTTNNGNEYNEKFQDLKDFYENARETYQSMINTQNYQPLGQALIQYYNNYQGLVRGFETLTNAETNDNSFNKEFMLKLSQIIGNDNGQLEAQVFEKYAQDRRNGISRKDAQNNALTLANQLAQQQGATNSQQQST